VCIAGAPHTEPLSEKDARGDIRSRFIFSIHSISFHQGRWAPPPYAYVMALQRFRTRFLHETQSLLPARQSSALKRSDGHSLLAYFDIAERAPAAPSESKEKEVKEGKEGKESKEAADSAEKESKQTQESASGLGSGLGLGQRRDDVRQKDAATRKSTVESFRERGLPVHTARIEEPRFEASCFSCFMYASAALNHSHLEWYARDGVVSC
jgi:hypothetical protein